VTITVDGVRQVAPFDFSLLRKMKLRLKVDVGPSSYWSEITALQTLDNLLQSDKINFLQYLKRVPNGVIPKKQELIAEIEMQMQQAEAVQQAMMMAQQEQMMMGGQPQLPPGGAV